MLDRSQAEEGEVQFDCRSHLVLRKNSPGDIVVLVFLFVSLDPRVLVSRGFRLHTPWGRNKNGVNVSVISNVCSIPGVVL